MKTIGLVGGSTWVSTAEYYRTINRLTQARLGPKFSASILLYSIKFHEFGSHIENRDLESASNLLCNSAKILENGGADCVLICANTPHMFVDKIQREITIPIIHIGEETAKIIVHKKLHRVGLLGTKPTMELEFYKEKLSQSGIEVVIPEEADRNYIHHSIFNEFSQDLFLPETKQRYLEIINSMIDRGAQGVILGCTEIPLLINQEDSPVPVFDTLNIHCNSAVEYANS